jgi:hypothetical protein
MQVMPQAPRMDPNVFSVDVLKQMQVAQAGMQLGQEIANLQNKRSMRELQAAQIDAAKSKNKLEMLQIDHAVTNLPTIVEAELTKAQAQIAADRNALATSTASAAAGLPQAMVNTQAAQTGNALASATADAPFAAQPAPARAQALQAAQTLGSWGVSAGQVQEGEVPVVFRENKTVTEIDPQTGNTVERIIVIDKRDGRELSHGEGRTTKLGVDEKSVAAASKDITALTQTMGLADELGKVLDEYIQAGEGGLGQAVATNAANSAPTGAFSVIKKAIGAKAQSEATVKLTGSIANLKNTIANALFGSALSKEESQNLIAMLPTSDDLADPERMRQKLAGTKAFLATKLKAYEGRGILEKGKFQVPSPTSLAPAANPAMERLKAGGTVMYKGAPHKLGVDASGQPALVPAQ